MLDTSVFSHRLNSPGGRDGLCGCSPAAAESREAAALMSAPLPDLANLVSWATLTAPPQLS